MLLGFKTSVLLTVEQDEVKMDKNIRFPIDQVSQSKAWYTYYV